MVTPGSAQIQYSVLILNTVCTRNGGIEPFRELCLYTHHDWWMGHFSSYYYEEIYHIKGYRNIDMLIRKVLDEIDEVDKGLLCVCGFVMLV